MADECIPMQEKLRLARIEAGINTVKEHVMGLSTWIFVGLITGAVIGTTLGIFLSYTTMGVKFEDVTEAYTEGYRQGVMDALGDPERALAQLLCTGDYSATVTIDGMEFTLSCTGGG